MAKKKTSKRKGGIKELRGGNVIGLDRYLFWLIDSAEGCDEYERDEGMRIVKYAKHLYRNALCNGYESRDKDEINHRLWELELLYDEIDFFRDGAE